MTLTYHNDPALKAEKVAQAKLHVEQDRLIAGTYLKTNGEWKGCSV